MDSGRVNLTEENHHGTGFRSAEKFIKIDSICIDLFSSNDKCDGQECEPFSIRGYVSDMCKKDSKICWPFSDIDHDVHILSVPPVFDPSFDLQRGKHHWQKSTDKVSEGFIFDSCHGHGTFSSASPKAAKQDVINGKTMIESALSNLSCQPSSWDEKEKKLELIDNSFVGLISQSEPGVASHEVTKIIAPVSENLMLKVTEEILEDGKQTAADHLNGLLTLVISENDSTVGVVRAHHAVKFQKYGNISMESNESTISSFKSAETVGNSPRHCHQGKFHRRRAPKIRLLAELLGEDGNVKAIHVQSSPSNETSEASSQADLRYASKCEVTMEENTWPSNHKREGRFPWNEKVKHEETPSFSVDKQVQTWRGEVENSVSSLGTENALSGRKKTMKGLSSSCKLDGNNSLRKKKRREFHAVGSDSVSLMPAITECENDKEALDSAAVIALPNEFSSKNRHPISLNTMESKCSTSKNPNSSKDLVMVEAPADVFSWNDGIIRKDSVTRKDVAMKSRNVDNTFQYANYKNNERELHLSLHNYSNPRRGHKGICRQEENGHPTFRPGQEDNISGVSKFTRDDSETSYHGYPNPPPYKASDAFYGQGAAESMLNGKMANLRMHLSRRNVDPRSDTSWRKLQKEDKYSGSNGKSTIEAQQPLALKKRQINQRLDLTSDTGTSDDIPMEIVELMAKNQYERRLPDAENNKHVSVSRAVQVNNYCHIYRNGIGLLQKPEILKQKAQARNGENAANRAGKIGQTRKRKSADHFTNIEESHINANHLQQSLLLRNKGSIHYQEEPSNGIQYSSIGSKRQSCAEISKCNEAMVEPGPYNFKVQSSEGYIDRLPVSGHSLEAARVRSSSSSMQNHLPNGCHRFPATSTGEEKIPSPTSFQMGNAMVQSYHNHHPSNIERHGRHNNFKAYSQKSAESSFRRHPNGVELRENQIGSLELYSNETISAMHLLSLMDAGMRTNAPMTAGGTQRSSKRPPIPRPLKRKEFCGMDIFNKTIPDVNQFSSASTFHFQQSRGFASDANSSGQVIVKSQNKAQTKCEDPSMWSKDQKLPKSQFRSNGLGTDDRTFPDNSIRKYEVNASSAEAFVLRMQHVERNSDECKFVAHTRTLQNQKRSSETEICSVNKNPADFTLPEAGNIYMIGAEDFNFGRTFHSKNISSSIYFDDGYKRPRHV